MSEVNMGDVPDMLGMRDAVHVAVMSFEAPCDIEPGEYVRVVAGCVEKTSVRGDAHGIADPFRSGVIRKGEWFWLFLMPNTVCGMRHHWTHPAFPESDGSVGTDINSETWLRAYAMRANCYDEPSKAFERLIEGLQSGELFFYGSDLHGRWDLDDEDDLRFHAQRYLGVSIDFGNFSFSCSC